MKLQKILSIWLRFFCTQRKRNSKLPKFAHDVFSFFGFTQVSRERTYLDRFITSIRPTCPRILELKFKKRPEEKLAGSFCDRITRIIFINKESLYEIVWNFKITQNWHFTLQLFHWMMVASRGNMMSFSGQIRLPRKNGSLVCSVCFSTWQISHWKNQWIGYPPDFPQGLPHSLIQSCWIHTLPS